jgi:Flp pilus assembly protein TadD
MAFGTVVRTCPQNHHALSAYSSMLLSMKRYKPAVEHLQRAILLSANSFEDWSNLGVAYENVAEQRLAAMCYQRAIEIDPEMPIPYYNLAFLYSQWGRYQAAEDLCLALVEVGPSDCECSADASEGGAQWEFDMAQRLKVVYNYATILKKAGKLDKSAAMMTQYLACNPNDGHVHHELGLVYYKSDKYTLAAKHFRRALEYKSGDRAMAESYSELAAAEIMYSRRSNDLPSLRRGVVAICHALRYDPDHGKALYNLAGILFNMEGAQMWISEVCGVHPDRAALNLRTCSFKVIAYL